MREEEDASRPARAQVEKRFFTLFDLDGNGTITLEELQEALTLLTRGNPMDKLKFLFQVYDVDGSREPWKVSEQHGGDIWSFALSLRLKGNGWQKTE
ncbi:Hypothetical predicted protein, partial [Marmota monax]